MSFPKILIFGPSLDAVSGVSTHINMIKESTLKEKFNFIHFQVGSEGRSEKKYEKLLRFAISPLQLAFRIISDKPDVIHINTSLDKKAFFRDFLYFLIAKALRKKIINQVHSGSDPENLFSKKILKLILRKFLSSSKSVIVLSNESLVSYRKFDKNIQISVIPNAINKIPLFQNDRNYLVDGNINIVYVGRIVREKGIFDVLSALTTLRDQGINFNMKIAGAGPDEQELLHVINKNNLSAEVKFLGAVMGEDKNILWLNSDLHVFPTYFNEGLPYSILESMAAGCVPITCPVAAIPDVIEDKVHGLFVPPRDPHAIAAAIKSLASDRERLRTMSAAGRQRINDYYLSERLAMQLEAEYCAAIVG